MNISHPRLSNLTLDHSFGLVESLNVVAPQLKNLTIIIKKTATCLAKQYLISAPGLTSLVISSGLFLHVIPTQGSPCLDKADLCCHSPSLADDDAHKIVCLLQHLHNVKFLTLNLEILEILSSSMEPISHHQPCPFANLNIFKFLWTGCCHSVYMEVQPHKNVTEIKHNLQDCFPRAILTLISREEIRGMRDIVSARTLIAQTQWLIKRYRAIYGVQLMPNREIEEVVTHLQRLEGLLPGLPAVSQSLVMQPIYSSVCEEAHIVKKNMLECTNIQYNNNIF